MRSPTQIALSRRQAGPERAAARAAARVDEESQRTAVAAARAALEKKAEDVVVLDLRGVSGYTDFLVIGSGGSDRQLEAIAESVEKELTTNGHRVFTGFIRDISERKQAEELRASLHQTQGELARISRLTTMGELTASIAHEVNQPLTAITNNGSACLRLLANQNLDPEVLRRALEEIVADGNRASAVIARIRGFIKKAPEEKSELDVNEVIQEVLALVGPELQKNRVSVECDLRKALPLVLADRVQLQQVLLNLVVNGIEAMTAVTERPRELLVKSQIEESGDLMVTVRDSGTGLSSEADRVFTPFFTTKANGMGMGLPISRSLVEGHGGRLWATPNSPHGAVFSFTLPATGSSS